MVGRGERGPTTGLTHELRCTSERCQRPPYLFGSLFRCLLRRPWSGIPTGCKPIVAREPVVVPPATLERHIGYLLPTLPGWAEAPAALTPSSISPLKGNPARDRGAAQRATPERPGGRLCLVEPEIPASFREGTGQIKRGGGIELDDTLRELDEA